MSLLSCKELHVVLSPERIAWHRATRELTVHGFNVRAHARGTIPCVKAAGGGAPWLGAVSALEAALSPLVERKMKFNVVLSDQFVQYVLVPWQDKLSDEEELVFAQHCFTEMFGGKAASWSVRVSPGTAGAATLASAVDASLLENLRGLAGRLNVNMTSIQPHLMAVYNSCQPDLERRSAWLALLERASLCLVLQIKGQIAWVRKMRVGDAWREELPMALEREAYLADMPEATATDDVLLWAPHLDEAHAVPATGRWNIRHLKPGRNGWHWLRCGRRHTMDLEA